MDKAGNIRILAEKVAESGITLEELTKALKERLRPWPAKQALRAADGEILYATGDTDGAKQWMCRRPGGVGAPFWEKPTAFEAVTITPSLRAAAPSDIVVGAEVWIPGEFGLRPVLVDTVLDDDYFVDGRGSRRYRRESYVKRYKS